MHVNINNLRNKLFMIKKLVAILFCISFLGTTHANEGMWILPELPDSIIKVMDKLGYELKVRDMYNERRNSLKDVVVSFTNGYSGVLISGDGLLLTNYHTVEQYINQSTDARTLQDEGFWATSYTREIPINNIAVSILKSTENVTKRILSLVPEFESMEVKQQIIDSISQVIIKEKQAKTTDLVELKSSNKNTQFHLYTYQRFNDVRLVYAPPANIALFGDELDKRSTPRHNANFAILRLYVSQDDKPEAYSAFNKPFTTKHYARISTMGYEMDDFVFSLGFPSNTNRLITSFALNEQLNTIHQAELNVALVKDKVWENAIRESNYVKNLYENRYTSNANRLKYLIDLQNAIKKQQIIAEKQKIEKSFTQWALKSDFNTMLKYEHVVSTLDKLYSSRRNELFHLHYLTEAFLKLDLLSVPYMLLTITPQNEREVYREIAKFYEKYDEQTEKKMLIAMLELYANQAQNQFMPDVFANIINSKKYKGDIDKYVDDVFKNSFITNEIRFNKYLDKPNEKRFNNDPLIILTKSIVQKYAELARVVYANDREIEHNTTLLVEGLQRKSPRNPLLADANYTLRMSFGTIKTYSPSDGIFYGFTANFEGIIEKFNTRNAAYRIDKRLIDVYRSKYNTNEKPFPVSFLTSIDYTIDKMGAPVFDTEGYLIGILADGNKETISNIFHYNERYQRTIALDIRYVLFIIEHYANAKRLFDKMTIVDE